MLADYIDHKPTILAPRLTLRPLTPADVPDLRAWTADPALYAHWGKGAGKIDKDPALLFARTDKPTKSFHLGLEERATGKVIGEIWVYLIEGNRMAKLACRIADARKGQGFATEALRAITDFCFTHTELRRLWTDVDVRNTASWRVLEKCGYLREGLIRQGKMVSTWCDYYLYAMLREDWEHLREQEQQEK